jgi:hypothetical protein
MGEWLADLITDAFQPMLQSLVEAAYSVFSYCVTIATGLFGVTPQTFKSGAPWRVINSINPIFQAVAAAIVVTVFLAGFIQESVNIRQDISLYTIAKLFIRLGAANAVIFMTMDICKEIFNLMANWATITANAGGTATITIPSTLQQAVRDVDWGAAILGTLVALICVIVAAVLGGMIIYTVYMRTFKLLILVPIAPVAFATMSGSSGMSSAGAYFKNLLVHSGEIVVIALALALSSAIVGTGIDINFGSTSKIVTILIQLLGGILSMAMVSGAVMGAEKTLREGFRF